MKITRDGHHQSRIGAAFVIDSERARRRIFAVSPASGLPKRNGVTRTTRTSVRAFVRGDHAGLRW